jgi:hypothetical protein
VTVTVTGTPPTEVWVCVFITAVPITKLFALGEDMCYELLFITAVPNTKMCAWGEADSGGHVL